MRYICSQAIRSAAADIEPFGQLSGWGKAWHFSYLTEYPQLPVVGSSRAIVVDNVSSLFPYTAERLVVGHCTATRQPEVSGLTYMCFRTTFGHRP